MAKAAAKKSAVKKPKDSWCYFIDGSDETYRLFPSYEAALKEAKSEIKSNSYDYMDAEPVKVQFFQLAAESTFEFEIKETPVIKREVVFKGEVK